MSPFVFRESVKINTIFQPRNWENFGQKRFSSVNLTNLADFFLKNCQIFDNETKTTECDSK
jgi:hypothetical protein